MSVNATELKSIYSYLQQSGIGAIAKSGPDYMNTIWSSLQDVEGIANGNDQQKAAGIQNLLNKVMGLIEKFAGANNETRRASSEVKGNGNDARDLTAEAAQTEQEMVAQIEAIKAELQGHIDVITNATANIADGTKNLQAQLDALKSIQEQIQEKQTKLGQLDKNSPDYKEQAQTLLNDINGLAGLIPAITSTISGMQELCKTESQNVANAYTAVETLKGNAVEVQTNGQEKIVGLSSKAVQEVQDNAQSQLTGTAENKPIAEAAQQAGQAAASNMFTASQAPKLFGVSTDQSIASSIRITSSGNNLQTLQQGIGRINSSNEKLTGFSGDLDAQLNTFNTAIGSWDETISQEMIVSIGSMDCKAISDASEELKSMVEADLETFKGSGSSPNKNLEYDPENEGDDTPPTKDDIANQQTSGTLQTIGFDIKKLGIQEGVKAS